MFKPTLIALLALATGITATLDPATSHSNATYPAAPACKPGKVSKAIQAAECSHNTRLSKQTFAVFTIDHQYDKSHGAPYGTCEAYNCAPGSKMTAPETHALASNSTGCELIAGASVGTRVCEAKGVVVVDDVACDVLLPVVMFDSVRL
ncbi:hypothetical protein BM1_01399 [Bipolaris maydis]|nr:hypothetical protein BM1_01399 [Bipolaris maydis]